MLIGITFDTGIPVETGIGSSLQSIVFSQCTVLVNTYSLLSRRGLRCNGLPELGHRVGYMAVSR